MPAAFAEAALRRFGARKPRPCASTSVTAAPPFARNNAQLNPTAPAPTTMTRGPALLGDPEDDEDDMVPTIANGDRGSSEPDDHFASATRIASGFAMTS